MLLNEAEVQFTIGRRFFQRIRCEDIEGHPLAGDNLMFRKRVSLLIDRDDDVLGG